MGARQWTRIAAVLSGFEANGFSQRLNAKGKVIPGLYGVGFTGGNLCGDVNRSFYLSGFCYGYCMTSGRYAAIYALTSAIKTSRPAAWSNEFATQYGAA